MDQLKEILKQAIKYRFWIAVGIAALFPMIGYFVGVGPIQAKAKAEADAIVGADKDVKQYSSGVLPNHQYKPIIDEKTTELTQDVNNSWKKLYARQAPLLKWPETVHERFYTWGRKWPENVDSSAIQTAIIDYVTVYPEAVKEVYQAFKPFDPVEGEGVVAAPPEQTLLRPAQFKIENPPSLGKVWASQERLWIQRTMLEVIADVNKKATDWDTAIIKQIDALEVGNPMAQDQKSKAAGESVTEAEAIDDPSKPAEESAAPAGGGGAEAPGGYADMMAGMMGSAMPGSGMATSAESVYYIANESTQYKILPVMMTVAIDQNRIQDFLVALENSPMTIQVMDFEMSKPATRITKPEKGAMMAGMMGGYGMMGGMMGGMMPGMEMGYGGSYAMMQNSMMSGMMPGMMEGYGMAGGMGGFAAAKKGKDVRSENRAKEFAKSVKAAKAIKKTTLQDPYYNIVSVTIYGQARFFNPPPAETTEPSQAEATAGTEGTAPMPAEGAAPAVAVGEPKADAPKAEEPKADAPKAEEPKADAPKAEEPKADAPKAEEPKADAPKAEEPKADAPKATEETPAK